MGLPSCELTARNPRLGNVLRHTSSRRPGPRAGIPDMRLRRQVFSLFAFAIKMWKVAAESPAECQQGCLDFGVVFFSAGAGWRPQVTPYQLGPRGPGREEMDRSHRSVKELSLA